jgi:hypothetical protein
MKRKALALFLALAMVFAFSQLAFAWPNGGGGGDQDNNNVTVYTDGSADAKVDSVQGAAGVAGLVTTDTSAKGFESAYSTTKTYSGDGAVGVNGFADITRCSTDCDKAGIVGVGHFNYVEDTTHTFSNLYVDNKQVANMYQNTANMTGSLIASATACGLPVAVDASQSQSFVQKVESGSIGAIVALNNPHVVGWGGTIPNLGTVTSTYKGATAQSIQIGNQIQPVAAAAP